MNNDKFFFKESKWINAEQKRKAFHFQLVQYVHCSQCYGFLVCVGNFFAASSSTSRLSALCSFGTKRSSPRSNATGSWKQFSRSSAVRITDALNPVSSPPYSCTVHCLVQWHSFAFCCWISLSEIFSQARPYSVALNMSQFSIEGCLCVCVCVCVCDTCYIQCDCFWRASGKSQRPGMATVSICELE